MSDGVKSNSASKGRFRAFVSYSHADKAAAQRLHRKLETYRLPQHLRASANDIELDGRIGAIFRDREDLSAAQDLTESVKEALSQSAALVVLCSPDAQQSPWVAREIELFRDIHPDRPILAALLRGEPEAAFPAPLREGREPLAADLRKEGDGERLGFLKVIAGIAGVPLDALINRDAQRRVRRVTAITVAAIAAMVVMALMTTFAIQSRNEAQREQARAEKLVSFMLGEHRTELRKIGSVEAMVSANRAALAYYQNQDDLSKYSDESLITRASVLHALGEDITTSEDGDLDQALSLFQEAFRSTAEILDRQPRDPDYIFSHAQSTYWVGYIDERREDFIAAHKRYSEYRALARRMATHEPSSRRSLMELGYGDLNMGIMSFKNGALTHAIEEFSVASKSFERADQKSESDDRAKVELANALSWLSNAYYDMGEYSEALEAQSRSADIKRAILEDDPENMAALYDTLIAERALALARNQLGEESLALLRLRQVASDMEALIQHDPSNYEWRALKERTDNNIRELEKD